MAAETGLSPPCCCRRCRTWSWSTGRACWTGRWAEGRPEPRVRAPGGGRKKLTDTNPGLVAALLAMVDPESRGDPQSPLRWTLTSTRELARALTAGGHTCSAPTVARLLKAEGYSLQGNAKGAEGAQHPDRDAQFRYIARKAREHLDAGEPVVSVDAKLGANTGWVSAGTDHDTSAFAAATLRRWWRADGSARYPHARRLLICADTGGSNAARGPGLEGGARRPGRRDRAAGHRLPLPARHLQVEQVCMAWRPPRSDEMPSWARRARSPSRYWSAESPQQVWRRARGAWDCRCEHEPQIRLGFANELVMFVRDEPVALWYGDLGGGAGPAGGQTGGGQ